MKTFGTLEYTIDKYSGSWTWKITGVRAVMMVSKLIPELWYGNGPNEVIIPDNEKNVKQISLILERYPLEILSKSVWQRKLRAKIIKKPTKIKTEKLSKAVAGKQFRGKLLNFQKMGLDFLLKSSGNALLADDMGLGKTVQTLAYIASEKQSLPALIVAPLVTLTNWQREIERFMKKKSKNGRIVENDVPIITSIRSGKRNEIPYSDFYLINYELLHKRQNDLAKLKIRTLVCDEVQHLRSKTTQKYKAVKTLASVKSMKYRVGLSGTPIYNHGSEIWPIVDILKPGLLGNFKEFCEYFCYQDEKGINKIWSKLEEEQKNAETEFNKLASYQRAIQSERQAAGVAKLHHVTDFVKNIMEIEESVVVFCHHKYIHKLLHESLQEFKPSSIIGGQNDKIRQENIDRFQNGDTKLMVAGLRAGSMGINLTRAKYVIFAELDWSPAIHRQAEDRLHRIGQKNTVFAYYLIGKRTLDEHVANILVDKSYEIDAIMDESHDSYENKEKAKLILAQIHDRLHTK